MGGTHNVYISTIFIALVVADNLELDRDCDVGLITGGQCGQRVTG
jgi:hypothetical protein